MPCCRRCSCGCGAQDRARGPTGLDRPKARCSSPVVTTERGCSACCCAGPGRITTRRTRPRRAAQRVRPGRPARHSATQSTQFSPRSPSCHRRFAPARSAPHDGNAQGGPRPRPSPAGELSVGVCVRVHNSLSSRHRVNSSSRRSARGWLRHARLWPLARVAMLRWGCARRGARSAGRARSALLAETPRPSFPSALVLRRDAAQIDPPQQQHQERGDSDAAAVMIAHYTSPDGAEHAARVALDERGRANISAVRSAWGLTSVRIDGVVHAEDQQGWTYAAFAPGQHIAVTGALSDGRWQPQQLPARAEPRRALEGS